jgi:hypothetical protein
VFLDGNSLQGRDFNEVQLTDCFMVFQCVLAKEILPYLKVMNMSSTNFIVSLITFRSIVYLGLDFVFSMR